MAKKTTKPLAAEPTIQDIIDTSNVHSIFLCAIKTILTKKLGITSKEWNDALGSSKEGLDSMVKARKAATPRKKK